MKRVVRGVFVFLFVCLLPLTAQAAGTLVPVGALVGDVYKRQDSVVHSLTSLGVVSFFVPSIIPQARKCYK